MYGGSYVGATQLLAARGAPAALCALAPGVTSSQYYDGWAYQGGAFALAFNASWASELGADQARRAGDEAAWRVLSASAANPWEWYDYLPLSKHPLLLASDYVPFYFEWLRHSSYDDYWRRWSIDEDYASISVPSFHHSGWYDVFARGTIRNFAGLHSGARSPRERPTQKLLMGPWQHVGWSPRTGVVDHGPSAVAGIDQLQLRWFDHFLRDEDGGRLDSPVSLFLMGRQAWLEESSWPPSGVEEQPLFLRSEGRANSVRGDGALSAEPPGEEPPDVFVYDPLVPTRSLGGHSCCYPDTAPIGPADQAAVENSGRVLVYSSPVLERDLIVVGPVSVVLYAATDRLDTDFTVRLCDVSPDRRSVNLLEGIIRARYRLSLSQPRDVMPGDVYEYRIDLGPVAHAFLARHRVRLQVASSDFPQWDRNLNSGRALGVGGPLAALVATQTVLHTSRFPSRLLLNVAEG